MFAAAQALSPQTGTVLVPRNDFPANTYPWIRAAERGGLAVRWIDGPVTAEAVRDALDSSVKAVAVSAVDAGTGFLAPLARIKEVIGADRVLAVDAVQAFGAVPFEVEAATSSPRAAKNGFVRVGVPRHCSSGTGWPTNCFQAWADGPASWIRWAPERFRTQPFPAHWPTR